jgi:hypothetical protein
MNEAHHHFISKALDTLLAEHQDIIPEDKVWRYFSDARRKFPLIASLWNPTASIPLVFLPIRHFRHCH